MFTITQVSWNTHQQALSALRRTVFIEEQLVPEDLEWDGLDEEAVHYIAWNLSAHPIGCLRLLPNFTLGRMAVLPAYRGQGVGSALLASGIDYASEANWPCIRLSAQVHAIGFYQTAGFVLTSEAYLDAGIPHRDMQLQLHFLGE